MSPAEFERIRRKIALAVFVEDPRDHKKWEASCAHDLLPPEEVKDALEAIVNSLDPAPPKE